jgi:hypothetical protein
MNQGNMKKNKTFGKNGEWSISVEELTGECHMMFVVLRNF